MNTRAKIDAIEVVGAETHNLKNASCTVPHNALTVISGVSGSGKSSLAFDTIYAEGQRRYVETLSTYARQFLQQMKKPPVRAVRNVPPALALQQGNSVNNARTSVGSVTEIDDHLRLLYAGAGATFCRNCGDSVVAWSVTMVADRLVEEHASERILVVGAIVPEAEQQTGDLLRQLAAEGHRRVYHEGALIEIDAPEAADLLKLGRLRVVMDRLKVEPESSRLAEAIERAYGFGERIADVLQWDKREDGEAPPELRFYDHHRCTSCDTLHQPPIPALFDTASQAGACNVCEGFGRTTGIDLTRVVPDPRRTLGGDAIACFQTPTMRKHQRSLVQACERHGVPTDVPWGKLSRIDRNFVLKGGDGFGGVHGFFESLAKDRYKPHIRILIAKYRGYAECNECDGSGLSADARAVRIGDEHLGAVTQRRIEEALEWVQNLPLDDELTKAMKPLVKEIAARLTFLVDAGVGYLTLARLARTLSGGEMHRVLLATSLGRMLTDTCYVLDEPTAGLHPHDTARLLKVIERLRDLGNTVVVVEHDPDVIERAQHVIELGPAGGEHGGEVVFEGSVEELRETDTATAEMLRARRVTLCDEVDPVGWLTLHDACLHNVQGANVRFPHAKLSVVTGVSGSGKSTLINDVLFSKLMETRGQRARTDIGPATITGDVFDEVVMVDQGSMSKSSRSCPMSLSGAYTPIRELYAGSAYAQLNGLTPGTFSFNTAGGRCDRCEGKGTVAIEMHFVADVELTCDVCDGRRFKDSVLAATYHGESIADVFDMTVAQAAEFFGALAPITRRLEPMVRVGLGYVKLGQATSQMSGGELQRLKLASYVGKSARKNQRLFLFDEPTVGLHMRDVEVLVAAMRELVDAGNTVIVVEHNMDLVAACDWVVDLGPGPGEAGGDVVYEGPVGGLLACAESLTATHLRPLSA
ncbi:MAG: excinuclease ABC subunit A [Bradymonadia bacterium]